MKHVFLINFIQCSVTNSIIFIHFHLYRKCFGIGRHLLSAPTKKKVADSPKFYQTDRQYGTSSDWANAENFKIVMKQHASFFNCAIKETRCASFPLQTNEPTLDCKLKKQKLRLARHRNKNTMSKKYVTLQFSISNLTTRVMYLRINSNIILQFIEFSISNLKKHGDTK